MRHGAKQEQDQCTRDCTKEEEEGKVEEETNERTDGSGATHACAPDEDGLTDLLASWRLYTTQDCG
jgi:hypothetical protein